MDALERINLAHQFADWALDSMGDRHDANCETVECVGGCCPCTCVRAYLLDIMRELFKADVDLRDERGEGCEVPEWQIRRDHSVKNELETKVADAQEEMRLRIEQAFYGY